MTPLNRGGGWHEAVGLGTWQMTKFGPDPRPLDNFVSSVPGPTGSVGLSPSAQHLRIGFGWVSVPWGGGYSGDVYADYGTSETLKLPAGTAAFYFYLQPNEFATYDITATAQDGTTSGPIPVSGSAGMGGTFFGFYDTAGSSLGASDPITSITITAPVAAGGFALGEFGIGGTSSGFAGSGSCGSSLC